MGLLSLLIVHTTTLWGVVAMVLHRLDVWVHVLQVAGRDAHAPTGKGFGWWMID